MARRLLKLGSRGAAVRELQQLLGFEGAAIDGVFGRQTDEAVREFQRSSGVEADGIVGPVTWDALTNQEPNGPDTPDEYNGTQRGRSLHIGLNRVDPAAYPVPVPPLRGCINDANDMQALATAQGFGTTRILLDHAATSAAVQEELAAAAADLDSGDLFLVTYSGHGGQVPDTTGEEEDAVDETWVLWDRQLLDDELAAIWAEFRPGVRVIVLSDSCHSGTMTRVVVLALRAVASVYEDTASKGFQQVERVTRALGAAPADQLEAALAAIAPTVANALYADAPSQDTYYADRIARAALDYTLACSAAVEVLGEPVTRNLPTIVQDADAHTRGGEYRQIKRDLGTPAHPSASVLLISGCQDNQLSLDGARNGLFTQTLLEVFSSGQFGDYADFHQQIVRRMPPNQIPNLYWATAMDPALGGQRPFTI